MARFDQWLDTLVNEKGMYRETLFEVEGEGGLNLIPLEVVLEAIKGTGGDERAAIKDNLIRIDFCNGDCLGYFRHLAGALAM